MRSITYSELFKPAGVRRQTAYNVMLVVGGSLLLALLAQISVPVPFSPVPITGQTFGVILVGALLGSKRGALTIVVYLSEGALGLPVFAGGSLGLAHLFGPTGGYLFGFIGGAYLTGLLAEHGWDRNLWLSILAMSLGMMVVFATGIAWLSVVIGGVKALQVGLFPFVPGAIVKIACAAALLPAGWRLIGSSRSADEGN